MRHGVRPPQRAVPVQFVQVVLDALAFPVEEAFDGVCKGRMGEPVRAAGAHRQQRAGHLVFALCAAFKPPVAVGNAPLDGLVVAKFEMQAVHPFGGAPVAAIRHALDRVETIRLLAMGRPCLSAMNSSQ